MNTIHLRGGVAALTLLAGAALASAAIGGVVTTNPNLPPDTGFYLTPADVHAMYSGAGLEFVLSNIRHTPFANTTIRTPQGPDELENFDSGAAGNVAVSSGGMLLGEAAFVANGPVTTLVHGKIGNVTGTFQTEMLALNLTGFAPFGPFMVRESPTLPSLGVTTVTDIGGGLFQIDSFFDVFTELSIDGGQTWMPSTNGPAHVDLVSPTPGAATMLGLGGLLAARRRR